MIIYRLVFTWLFTFALNFYDAMIDNPMPEEDRSTTTYEQQVG